MKATIFCKRSVFVLTSVFVGLSLAGTAGALVCANDPSRTIFAGGPHTEACSKIPDQATCVQAFHRSGAGFLAPCVWTGGNCEGNTGHWQLDTPQSCERLPPQNCAGDPTRTIKLAGGTTEDSGVHACQTLTDQTSCEMAWHTTFKGAGMACCWTSESTCQGSADGFSFGGCTHDNTCFLESVTPAAAAAPAASGRALFALAATLFCVGAVKLRVIRHPRS